jgi:hypothetical protein
MENDKFWLILHIGKYNFLIFFKNIWRIILNKKVKKIEKDRYSIRYDTGTGHVTFFVEIKDRFRLSMN